MQRREYFPLIIYKFIPQTKGFVKNIKSWDEKRFDWLMYKMLQNSSNVQYFFYKLQHYYYQQQITKGDILYFLCGRRNKQGLTFLQIYMENMIGKHTRVIRLTVETIWISIKTNLLDKNIISENDFLKLFFTLYKNESIYSVTFKSSNQREYEDLFRYLNYIINYHNSKHEFSEMIGHHILFSLQHVAVASFLSKKELLHTVLNIVPTLSRLLSIKISKILKNSEQYFSNESLKKLYQKVNKLSAWCIFNPRLEDVMLEKRFKQIITFSYGNSFFSSYSQQRGRESQPIENKKNNRAVFGR